MSQHTVEGFGAHLVLQIFALRWGRRRDDIDVIVGVAVFDHLLTDLRREGRIVGNNCDMSAGVCLVAEVAGEGKQRTDEQRQGDGGDFEGAPANLFQVLAFCDEEHVTHEHRLAQCWMKISSSDGSTSSKR